MRTIAEDDRRTYDDVMLFIHADGMTTEELDGLRQRHDIVNQQGYVTVLNARKVEGRIVWSQTRMKEGYWQTLQKQQKMSETPEPSLV